MSSAADPDEPLDTWVRRALDAALASFDLPRAADEDPIAEVPLDVSDVLFQALDESDEPVFEADQRFRESFVQSLRAAHHEALWSARMALLLAYWLNRDTYRRFESLQSEEHSPQAKAILWVHGRAVLTTDEILTLAEHGFASGALARWRTLHELEVVAFLLKNGDDELGAAYLEHERVQAGDLARSVLEESAGSLDSEYAQDLEESVKAADQVLAQRGSTFRKPLAWAAQVLPQGKQPSFKNLEAAADAGHMRRSYEDASDFVHAGGLGTGLAMTSGTDRLYPGPSGSGIEPVVAGAIETLANVTDSLRWTAYEVVEPTEAALIADALHSYVLDVQTSFNLRSSAQDELPRRGTARRTRAT